MSVDIFLPFVRVDVLLFPGDPRQPTDLEMAALHFIRHHADASAGARLDRVAAFLQLGDAMLNDMLIRFLSRGWIRVWANPSRLEVTEKVREILDAPTGAQGGHLPTLEEGKQFRLWYDLITGSFAVIPARSMSRSMDRSEAVPRRIDGPDLELRPYGKLMTGFLDEDSEHREPRDSRILRALQSDRQARNYLLSGSKRGSMKIKVVPPGRRPGLGDIWFCRCQFEVAKAPVEEDELPILRCIEQRNRLVRRIGERAATAILDLAVEATKPKQGDKRFLSMLRRNATVTSASNHVGDAPQERLRQLLAFVDDGQDGEDLLDVWDQVVDRIGMQMASRIDFERSRVLAGQAVLAAAAQMVASAQSRALIVAPALRSGSSAFDSGEHGVLAALSRLSARLSPPAVHVHSIHGPMASGTSISDEVAVNRLLTALGPDVVNVVDPQRDHMRTALVLVDCNQFLLLSGSILGDQGLRALQLTLLDSGSGGTFDRLTADLPQVLRDRMQAASWRNRAKADDKSWPRDVAKSVNELDAMLGRLVEPSTSGTDEAARRVSDVNLQLEWLNERVEAESNAVEALVGPVIRNEAWRLVLRTPDSEPLCIGIASRRDTPSLTELREAIATRLSRQSAHRGMPRGRTIIFLPKSEAFDAFAAELSRYFEQLQDRGIAVVEREALPSGLSPPFSFVLSGVTAVLAQDGLLNHVPTAGRAIKGTQLGLRLIGAGARQLALEFVKAEWPRCATALLQAMPNVERHARPVSGDHRTRLLSLAARRGWWSDGNRGAHGALRAIEERELDLEDIKLGLESETSFDPEALDERRLAYALVKAGAILEHEGAAGAPKGALSALARSAWVDADLAVAALLADHMPEGAALRKPLARKLAWCVAFQQPPTLSPEDYADIESPEDAVLALACLLMLEGQAGDLPAWLSHFDPSVSAGVLVEFTRALAVHIQNGARGRLDLSHVETTVDVDQLAPVFEEIASIAERESHRSFGRLAPPVLKLHQRLFDQQGSFAGELFRIARLSVRGASEASINKELDALLHGELGDLGLDLFELGKASGRAQQPHELSERYITQQNKLMARSEGLEEVRFTEKGRQIQTTLRRIMELTLEKLVPYRISRTAPEELVLRTAARSLLSLDNGSVESGLDPLLAALIRRIRTNAQGRKPWTLPILAGFNQPWKDWTRARDAFLKAEFESTTSFQTVVQTLLDQGRQVHGSLEANSRLGSPLEHLDDLLRHMSGRIEPDVLSGAHEHLDSQLKAIAEETGGASQEAKSLADTAEEMLADGSMESRETDIADGIASLREAYHDTIMASTQLSSYLAANDTIGAILAASELLQRPRPLMHAARKRIYGALLAHLRARSSEATAAEIERIFPLPGRGSDLARVRRRLRLASLFERKLQLRPDVRYDLSEGLQPRDEVPANASGIVRIILAARRSNATLVPPLSRWMPSEIAGAIAEFFSDLPEIVIFPTAVLEGELWRVEFRHPSIAALAFGTTRIQFLIPTTRAAESTVRDRTATIAAASHIVPRDRPRLEREQILLSLWHSDPAPGLPTVPWRRLADLCKASVKDRRLGIAAALSPQCLGGTEKVSDWWEKSSDSWAVVKDLIGFDDGSKIYSISERELAMYVSDVCFALGLYTEMTEEGLALSQLGVSEIARLWPESRAGVQFDSETMHQIVTRLVCHKSR